MRRRSTLVGIAALTAALTASPGFSERADEPGEMAEMKQTAQRVEWTPRIEYERMVLTISGQDVHVERDFEPGDKPRFEPVDENGKPLPDGGYTWELRAAPKIDPEVRERLAEIRESGDQDALAEMRRKGLVPARPMTRSGYFQVREGRLVDGRTREESREPRPKDSVRVQSVAGDLEIEGDLSVSGTKSFVVPDPRDPGRAIYFAALEGPEAGTYYRGTAATRDGRVVIELPEVFASLTEAQGLTVQLTPLAGWARLWVEEKTPGRLVVRQVEGDPPVRFDFLVQGVRKGYSGYRVVRQVDGGAPQPVGAEGGEGR